LLSSHVTWSPVTKCTSTSLPQYCKHNTTYALLRTVSKTILLDKMFLSREAWPHEMFLPAHKYTGLTPIVGSTLHESETQTGHLCVPFIQKNAGAMPWNRPQMLLDLLFTFILLILWFLLHFFSPSQHVLRSNLSIVHQ
jgi:hypothetical protein